MATSLHSQDVSLRGAERISEQAVSSVLPPDHAWRHVTRTVGELGPRNVKLNETSAWAPQAGLRLWVRLRQHEDRPGRAVLSVDISSRMTDFDEEKGGILSNLIALAIAVVGGALVAWRISGHVDPASMGGKIAMAFFGLVGGGACWVIGLGLLITFFELPVLLASTERRASFRTAVLQKVGESSAIDAG